MESYILFALIALGAFLTLARRGGILKAMFALVGISIAVLTFGIDTIAFHPWLSVLLFFVCIACLISIRRMDD